MYVYEKATRRIFRHLTCYYPESNTYRKPEASTMAEEDIAKPGVGEVHLETIGADLKAVDGTLFIENREEKEKALLRRIDMRMMPLMMLLCKLESSFAVFHENETT